MKYFTLTFAFFTMTIMLSAQCVSGDCDNGEGTYVYKDGTKYIGAFKSGKAHGTGTCYYSNGDKYTGQWAGHDFNGKGTLKKKSGKVLAGVWQRGKLIAREGTKSVRQSKLTASKGGKKILKKPKVWAVIVGVARYMHMQSLNFTDDDAYRMYAFLKSPEGGALPDEQVKILVDESATKKKIEQTLTEVFAKAEKEDMIIFYFSGHGEKEGLLPIDYDGYDNVLEHGKIKDLLNQSKAKYKLCIADACYAGTMEETLTETKSEAEKKRINKLYSDPMKDFNNTSLALFMSSQAKETSVENAGLRQGIFSHFLLRALKGEADLNKDGGVTLLETFNFVKKHVVFYTNDYQTPIMVGNNVKKDLILSITREERP